MCRKNIELCVEHLNGWLRACEFYENSFNNNIITGVYMLQVDLSDIQGALTKNSIHSQDYLFGEVKKANDKEFYEIFQARFFGSEFDISYPVTGDLLNRRKDLTVRVIDLINICRSKYSLNDVFHCSVELMNKNYSMEGSFFVFPIDYCAQSIILKIMRNKYGVESMPAS